MLDGEQTSIPVPALSSDAPGQPLPLAAPPGEKKKRIRRTKAELEAARKKEEGDAAPAVDPQDVKECKEALSVTFQAVGAIVAGKRGEHWRIQKEEAERVAEAWAIVLAPYLPKVGQAVPVVGALVVTWGLVAPRLEEDQRQRARRKMEAGPASTPAPAPAAD